MHCSLDVSFGEDQSRARVGDAAENFSIMRRIALNLIPKYKSRKFGVKNKRLCTGWDDDYRTALLMLIPI